MNRMELPVHRCLRNQATFRDRETPMNAAQTAVDRILRRAIAARRLVTFVLDDRRRIAEPHDYGVIDGVPRLFFYQSAVRADPFHRWAGGGACSPSCPGWSFSRNDLPDRAQHRLVNTIAGTFFSRAFLDERRLDCLSRRLGRSSQRNNVARSIAVPKRSVPRSKRYTAAGTQQRRYQNPRFAHPQDYGS